MKNFLKLSVVMLLLASIVSPSAFARSQNNSDKIRINLDQGRGFQISSPYLKKEFRNAERKKNQLSREPERRLNQLFRDYDRKLNNKINGR